MECNKVMAFKAKEIAERKFMERDIIGAKKFAMEAKKFYAELDGLSQFLTTLDMYMYAEVGANGEVDWYKVLGVEPSADDDTIRKHFRKLALVLHPDKNKSAGADGAFRILSEAWSCLSDNKKKLAYDEKRNLRDINQKVPNCKPSVPTGQNGFHNNSSAKIQKSSVLLKRALSSFWTICKSCKMKFEYVAVYRNCKLQCRNCREPFLAVEVPPPPINGNSSPTKHTSSTQGQKATAQRSGAEYPYASGKKSVSTTNMGSAVHAGAFSHSGNIASVLGTASSTAQAEKLKRKHDKTLATSARESFFQRKTDSPKETAGGIVCGITTAASVAALKGGSLKKKIRIDEPRMHNNGRQHKSDARTYNPIYGGASESVQQTINLGIGRGDISRYHKTNSTRVMPELTIRDMLSAKAKKAIFGKVKEWLSVAAASKSLGDKMEIRDKGKQKAAVDYLNADAKKCQEAIGTKIGVRNNEASAANSDDNPGRIISDPFSMSVPDSDFHDFDKDRTEKSFSDNQVWAVYDDADGMPRFYAMVHSVLSLKRFKLRISWLNSKSNRELSPLNWIDSGFKKTSGDFWIGKYEVNKSLNSFSHKVKWKKGTRGTIQIYPRKGDVWALYRNWSPDWTEQLTPEEVVHKYDMVEVLGDYNKERGVAVAPLVKVAGFKAVFCRHSDPNKAKTIPREEMFRFSHQVPSLLLNGQEGHNAPKGCWELDPASVPLELLQVLTEVQLQEMAETAEISMDKSPFGDAEILKEEQMVENDKIIEDRGAAEDAEEAKKNKGKENNLLVYKRKRNKE